MMRTLGAASVVALGLLAAPAYAAGEVQDGTFSNFGFSPWSVTGSADVSNGAQGVIKDTTGTISQILTVVTGQLYTVSAVLGKINLSGMDFGVNNKLSVYYAGDLLGTFKAAVLPTNFSANFVGVAGGALSFEGLSDRMGNALTVDEVSVTAVPGPLAGAGLPVVAGMVAYGFWRRRKQVQAA